MQVLTNFVVVITLQYMHMSNHHIATLNLHMMHVNILIKLEKSKIMEIHSVTSATFQASNIHVIRVPEGKEGKTIFQQPIFIPQI